MTDAAHDPPPFVVGIGASAGGLDALVELLGAVSGTGMAFIVVQHLDPTHESLLPEILAKKTTMAVSPASAGEAVQADHVYVIPPDMLLTVHDGLLEVKRRTSAPERPFPVDLLFSSLAVAYGERAIGVVLSGADADGSRGLREIKHAGGFTFAQQPESARFPTMPRQAIETGCVDLVLRPKEIAGELERLSRRFRRMNPSPDAPSDSTPDAAADRDHVVLAQIFQMLRSAHGVDFTHYKRTTIRRRIARRMMLRRIETLDEYRESLDRDPAELAALHQDFLIRVTEFFRDPAAFDVLRHEVLPALCEGRSPREPIRVWVPGCATGEEVYSIAITLLEYFGGGIPPVRIQIFGTDVSETALETARAGVYPINALHEVSAERLERFFVGQDGEYRISKDIRDLCLFARQDVTRDPPFSKLDVISCRNLLIYLDDIAQRRVLRTFHYALRPGGMLFFGPAESVAHSRELFEQIDSRARIFRRMPNTGGGAIAERADGSGSLALAPQGDAAPLLADADSLPREADRLLLARFAPACVLVNQALTILQFRGQTGPYLEPAGGTPSFDLRRVVRQELLVQILPAIDEASRTGVPSRRDVRLDTREIRLEILPLAGSGGRHSFLILFDDGSRPPVVRSTPAVSALTESEKDQRLAQLERELEGMREYMRASLEAHEAVQEELRSAHEEMLSTNEEFQSTNEELETSKEELQSTNEELTTTIDELRVRNQELARLNVELEAARRTSEAARSHADTIIQSVREPLAVLDGSLRVVRVNAAFAAHLASPREAIEGRRLHEIAEAGWNIPDLHQRLRALLASGQPLEDWEVTRDTLPQGHQVLSLSGRRIPGDADRSEQLLLSIRDITAQADTTAGLIASGERKDQFMAMLGHELRHPLTPITHAIYLLRKAHQDPATVELLETIDTQSQTLLRFVNELLDLSRISRGLIEFRPERIDLAAVARDAVNALQSFLEQRRHVVSLVLPAALYVRGDADRLRQVVSNLVENAAKYTDPGGRITVTLEPRGGDAVLSVRDTGIGIAAGNLERIFEPFTQSHQPLAGPSGGLGIGLSVVRRIVEVHGGHVTVTSAGANAGSEFVVSVPISAADQAPVPDPEAMGTTSAPPVPLRARRVMIVDDHEEIRESLARLARGWDHEIAVAPDGESALALAETFQPECAIVDLSMPGMNGIELGRRLRERFPAGQLRLIALSGFVGADIRDACLVAGFDAYLVKPGEIPELERLLGADRT